MTQFNVPPMATDQFRNQAIAEAAERMMNRAVRPVGPWDLRPEPAPAPRPKPRKKPLPKKGTFPRWLHNHGIKTKTVYHGWINNKARRYTHYYSKGETLVVTDSSRNTARSAIRDLVIRSNRDDRIRSKLVESFGEQACDDLASTFGFMNIKFTKETTQ